MTAKLPDLNGHCSMLTSYAIHMAKNSDQATFDKWWEDLNTPKDDYDDWYY